MLAVSPLHPILCSTFLFSTPFFIKPREKRFAVTSPVTLAGCIFFLYDIIYDINFTPVKAAPAGVVKRTETLPLLSLPAISLSLEQAMAYRDQRGRERKGFQKRGVNSGPLLHATSQQ